MSAKNSTSCGKARVFATAVCLLLVLSLVLSGCRGRNVPEATRPLSPPDMSQMDAITYDIGLQVYLSGDYRQAAGLFESLVQEAEDPVVRRKARFGLACARLAAAETEEEYRLALADWKGWEGQVPEEFSTEDPRLFSHLVPMLERAFREEEQAVAPAPSVPDNMVYIEVQELRGLTESVRQKENEIDSLQGRIRTLNAAIRENQEKQHRAQAQNANDSAAAEALFLANERLQRQVAEMEAAIETRQEEVSRLSEELAAKEQLARENKELHARLDELQGQVRSRQEEMAGLTQTAAASEGLVRENENLQNRLAELEDQVEQRENELVRLARTADGKRDLDEENARLRSRLEEMQSRLESQERTRVQPARSGGITDQTLAEENAKLREQLQALESLYEEIQTKRREFATQ